MKLNELFYVYYPKTLIYSKMTPNQNGIHFVSSQDKNNGVVGRVTEEAGITVYPAGCITVPLKGSVLMAHLQKERCYVAHQIGVLVARKPMSDLEKLYYVTCIQSRAYLYSYGRQADKTLEELEVPEINPNIIHHLRYRRISTAISRSAMPLHTDNWCEFRLGGPGGLFQIQKGKRLTKADMIQGNDNFLGAIDSNNGVRQKITADRLWKPNCITVNYNGSVGEAFYQAEPFWASDDVNVLYPNGWELNKYIGLFIATVIKAERFKYNYGRKWKKEIMTKSIIKLPAKEGKPDFQFMEDYIKGLPYSDRI